MKMFRATYLLFLSAFLVVSCTQKIDDKDTTLNFPLSANVKGLDPVGLTDVYSNYVVSQIFEPLFDYHYLKRPLQLKPLLAAEMPTVSKDGLTHTIKIKPGVKFQDSEAFPDGKGRELVAEDFIYSWKRIADPANQSENFWIFDNRIVGFNEWREKIKKGEVTYDTPIEGLKATDKYTIVIKLKKPYYQLNYVLAMASAAAVPKEAVEKFGKEFLNHPVGTGPYKFDSWTRNSKIVLSKNPTWHGETYPTEGEPGDKEKGLLEDAGKPLPFVEKVVFHEIIEDQPRWLNLMKGNLDYMGIPKDNFDAAIKGGQLTEDMKGKGFGLYITQEPDVTYTSFNMDDPVVGKNANLRKAIALATDTPTLIEKFYNGRAIVAQGPIPPDVDGYDANFKNEFKEYNISKAKEFLAKAGFPEGKGAPVLEYSTTNSTTARQMAEYFQQNMKAIGLDVKIISNSWPQFTDKIRERKAQVWGIAWAADYPDAENFLQLLYGPNASPGPNGSNYNNKQFNELYDKAAHLPPGPERTKVYQQMRDVFVKDLPWIPDAHRLGYYMYHGWLSNLKHHQIIYDQFKYLRIDPKKRAELKAKL